MTVDDLITELNEAREVAKENGNPTAMISATMSKAKLLGLDNQTTAPQPHLPPVFNIVGVSPDDIRVS